MPHRAETDLRPMHAWSFAKKINVKKIHQNHLVYDYTASHNRFGFRNVLGLREGEPKKHFILAGCSIVYGDGLDDQDTSTSFLQKKLNGWKVYNLGYSGLSSKEQLYLWRFFDLKSMIPESEGVFVFNHFNAHFERIANGWAYLDWIDGNAVDWITADGKLLYGGILKDTKSWRWARWIKEQGLSYFWLRIVGNFNYWSLKSAIPKSIDLLEALRTEYLRQYPQGRFVITKPLFEPWLPEKLHALENEFLNELKRRKFEIWENDYLTAKLLENSDVWKGGWYIPYDGHPTAKYNNEFAEFLKLKLNSK